ncbi:hypothetical protein GCM10027286_00630 [Virgibacillus ainsalahensis]
MWKIYIQQPIVPKLGDWLFFIRTGSLSEDGKALQLNELLYSRSILSNTPVLVGFVYINVV